MASRLDHPDAALEVARRMERIYRPQTRLYDATRKYYLLGRDRLLAEVGALPGESVLEIGCGTGRNLVRLGRLYPGTRVHGLEPAPAMLEAAAVSLGRHGLLERSRLVQGIAETWSAEADFAVTGGFDHILFSYALSMMPDPAAALWRALDQLRPGGVLHLVDFGDLAGLPAPLARALRVWLAWFEVHPRPDAGILLQALAARGAGRLATHRLVGGYAVLHRFRLG